MCKATIVKVSGKRFAAILSAVSTMACKDKTIPLLNSVNIRVNDGTMTIEATDRYRLMQFDLACESDKDWSILIPVDILKNVAAFYKTANIRGLDEIVFHGTPSDKDSGPFRLMCGVGASRQSFEFFSTVGDYPPLNRIFADDDKLANRAGLSCGSDSMAFNPAFMASICKAVDTAFKGTSIPMHWYAFTGKNPAQGYIEDDIVKCRFILMHVRFGA